MVQIRDPQTPPPPPDRAHRLRPPTGVLLAALAVIVLRLPFVNTWLGKDEAGFLEVGRQWHRGGSSLYGNYWVDRPPLLITIFRVAAVLGGTVPLRLIGIGAAVIAVLAIAHAANTLAGPRAATWTAVTAAALLVSPLAGAAEVNGELLATPFIAIGIAASLVMLTTSSTRRALAAAALTGAVGVLAVLVKQNMIDVFIFAGILALLRARSLGASRLGTIVGGFLGGAAVAGGVMVIWTIAHGTSLGGIWFAMYRFRIEADALLARTHGSAPAARGLSLLLNSVGCGMILLMVLLLVHAVRAPRDNQTPQDDHTGSPASSMTRSVPLALIVTLIYDVASIVLGGSYWGHYLVQLTLPLALAAGLAATLLPRTSRLLIAALVVSAAWSVLSLGLHPTGPGGNQVGKEIAAVSRPGDTIVTVWGHPDVTHASGLTSPYPHLWSLPEFTLDSHTHLLHTTLTGPDAPTWFVTWTGPNAPGIKTSALKSALRNDYHRVAKLHGHAVYLHNGVQRAVPTVLRNP